MKKSKKAICVCMCACMCIAGCSDVSLKAVLYTTVPDVENGVKGKGFTCTGLAYDKNEDVFYVGNIGKDLPSTQGFQSTIVKVSKDFSENLGEIDIYETFPEMDDIQGICVDYSNDSIWFCSFSEKKVRNINKDGTEITYFDIEQPTGIAYDSRSDSLWVLTYTELKNITKEGEVLTSIAISINGQDQLYLDEENDMMYLTAGNNYSSSNFVYIVNLKTEEISKKYTLEDSYAVEGIYIENSEMYILNDGYYHDGKIPVNQVNKYNIDIPE